MKKVLIAYHSDAGSTKEVSYYMQEKMNDQGIVVDVYEFDDVDQIKQYDEIIIGAPVNGMRWHPSTKVFINKYESELSNKKVSYFLLSFMIYEGRNMWRKAIKNAFKEASQIVPPFKTGYFGGVIDEEMPLFARILFGLKKGMPLDQRNYNDIDTFIEEITK
jgi:menaquinone-dependent protoporphyrinogen oxidase